MTTLRESDYQALSAMNKQSDAYCPFDRGDRVRDLGDRNSFTLVVLRAKWEDGAWFVTCLRPDGDHVTVVGSSLEWVSD